MRFPSFALLLVFAFIAQFAAAQQTATTTPQSPPDTRKALPLPAPPASTDQEQFISYWTTETGWRSELQLRNNQATQDLVVTPVLRSADGTETPLSSVAIKPNEVKSIDLDTAIGTSAPQLIGTFGSLVLRFHSASNANLYPVLMVRSIGHSIAFHIDGTDESRDFQVGGREGIWWLPSNSTSDYLILTNQGANTMLLDLSLFDANGKGSTQKVILAPGATNRVSVRQLVSAAGLTSSYGGIKVSAATHAGSLDTLHVLFDQKAGFSAVMKMFDYKPIAQIKERDYARTGVWTLRAPMLALSSPDPALAFPVGTTLQPQLFVRNITAKPIDAALLFNWRSDSATGKSSGPALRLSPYETRRIDVAALQDGKTLPQDAHWTSVALATNGLPDEVMAVAASYDQSFRYGAQTPFSDQLASHWEGSMWEVDPYHNSIITVGNGGTKATQAAFTIFYNQGAQKYELEQTLQADEQMWIDIGKLIREHLPDKNDTLLPADLTSGSYEIREVGHKGIGSLFEGKVIYDKTYGHVSYGCASCCGLKLIRVFFDPLGIPLLPGGTPQGVGATDTCSGQRLDITGDFDGSWSTANTAIATVDTYGVHTGIAVGSTSSLASAQEQVQGRWNYCPINTITPGGTDNVHPTINITMKFTGNKSSGDNLMFGNATDECSESLGAKDCTSTTGYWLWNLEGNGVVSDDASKWSVQVQVQYHYKGQYRDANNNLHPFECLATTWSPDGPRADYLQQPAGQKSIFFIDGPGLFHGTNPSNQCQLGSSAVDSMTDVLNFQATFSSNTVGFVQGVLYFVKIVVSPGGNLDYTNSIAGYGNISLNF